MGRKWTKRDFVNLQSDFNMSQLDILRMDEILKRCDDYSLSCGTGKYAYLIEYNWALRALYRYIRPLLNRHNRTPFEAFFEGLYDILYIHKRFNMEVFRKMEILHNTLLDQRQLSGLGVMAHKKVDIPELKEEFR